MMRKYRVPVLLAGLFLAAVVLSLALARSRVLSLRLDSLDFSFYAQFASKIPDAAIEKVYTSNPSGYNWLYFHGVDGSEGMHHSIHLEPVKYAYAALYGIGGESLVFLFVALLFFFPLLYLIRAIPVRESSDTRFVLGLALVYALIPSFLAAPGFDLRPYVLLAPLFFLATLALVQRRPGWERLLLFNAMFLIREEALIFGAVLLVFEWARSWREHDSKRALLGLLGSWLLWLGAFLAFTAWAGYPTSLAKAWTLLKGKLPDGWALPVLGGGIAISAAALAALLVFVARRAPRWLRSAPGFSRWVPVLSYSLIFVPFGILVPLGYIMAVRQGTTSLSVLEWTARQAASYRYVLHFSAFLGLLVVLRSVFRSTVDRATGFLFPTLIILLAGVFFLHPSGYRKQLAFYRKGEADAAPVFALRAGTDKYATRVLTDEGIYQAFYGYQKVYVYSRLPWTLIPGAARMYPENRKTVLALLRSEIEVVVVSRAELPVVDSLIAESGRPFEKVFENAAYTGYRAVE